MLTITGISGSPTASRLILRAASRYRSIVAGETNNRSAMLSKPLLTLSAGSSNEKSISFGSASSASRSRTAFWYSVRLKRCSSGSVPGFGFAAAERSSSLSRNVATESYVALSGRGAPGGGIVAERSLRMTFSQTSGLALTRLVSAGSITSPAVFSRALWHVTQYCVKTAAGVWACRGHEHITSTPKSPPNNSFARMVHSYTIGPVRTP